jgi:carbonic anhydrase
MRLLSHLFENNRRWAAGCVAHDPDFFNDLCAIQQPDYLWIGCSDSRVPANEIVGLLPGELFVHRNVANVVVHSDLNCLSVIQFAVDVLRVEHIIVCGHYGCGGVKAAVRNQSLGLIDNWLRHVQDVRNKHALRLQDVDGEPLTDRLCELNIVEQGLNVAQTTVVQDAWARGQALAVHGWVYGLHDGRLRDLDATIDDPAEAGAVYARAVQQLCAPGRTAQNRRVRVAPADRPS